VEPLEQRLLRTAWDWNAVMIHQDQAAADFPWLTGAGQAVVVIDTGAYANHPSLAGKNIIWKDFVGSSSNPVDTDGHGTGDAGILVGNGFTYAGTYGQGIAPGAQLIVLRTDDGNDATPWATQAQRISNALSWVIANQAKYNIVAVNMSTGGDAGFTDLSSLSGDPDAAIDQVLAAKFATLADMGVFLGAAAGNDGATMPNTVEYPAADPNVYAISSVNSAAHLSSFASRGAMTDLLAPGEDTVMPYYFPGTNTYYVNYGLGTSFSTPLVVGAAVLMKQIDPSLSPDEIMSIMQQTGTPVSDSVTGHTFALLNLDAALKAAYAQADDLNNHSLGTATPLAFTDNVAQLTGLTGLLHATDYYRFTLGSAADVTFNFSSTGAAPAMALVDQNGNALAMLNDGSTMSLSAGTYYVRAAIGAASIDYDLTLTAAPTSDPGPVSGANDPGAGATAGAIALDAAGQLHLAYFDSASHALKYALRNADGTWNTIETIDASYNAGTQLSIAIDPNGLPGIAYLDAGTGHLKYAHFTGATWTVTTVDKSRNTGLLPSLCFTATGAPYIAYYRAASQDLRVACLSGKSWKIATVDTKGNIGYAPSAAYDAATNTIGVGYEDLTHGWFKYAWATPGKSWKKAVVDTTTRAAGGNVSLAFSASHVATMTYADGYSGAVKLASGSGASWSVQQITGAFGMTSELSFNGSGAADVIYANGGSISQAVASGGIWSVSPISAGGTGLGEATGAGRRAISWIDSSGVEILDL
jgi:hypothetical protein